MTRLDSLLSDTAGMGLADSVLGHDLAQAHTAGLDIENLLFGESRNSSSPLSVLFRMLCFRPNLKMIEPNTEGLLAEMVQMLPLGNRPVGNSPCHQMGEGGSETISGSCPAVSATATSLPDVTEGHITEVEFSPDLRLSGLVSPDPITRYALDVAVSPIRLWRDGRTFAATTAAITNVVHRGISSLVEATRNRVMWAVSAVATNPIIEGGS